MIPIQKTKGTIHYVVHLLVLNDFKRFCSRFSPYWPIACFRLQSIFLMACFWRETTQKHTPSSIILISASH